MGQRLPLQQLAAFWLIVVLVAVVVWQCCLHLRFVPYQATVIKRVYKPSTESTRTVEDSKGNFSTVTTGSGEGYLLIVRDTDDGYTHSVAVLPNTWGAVEEGQTMSLKRLGWVK